MDKLLRRVVFLQLKNFFGYEGEKGELGVAISDAAELSMNSLKSFNSKYLKSSIDPYNGVQYCNFLYYLSRQLYQKGDIITASMVYRLNSMLHSLEIFYEVEMPKSWSCEHPVGAVMGRATYGERFFFFQGCTVGASVHNGRIYHPIIGNDVIMWTDSKILGKSRIGNNVTIGTDACIIDEKIPDNSYVFGKSPNLIIKDKEV